MNCSLFFATIVYSLFIVYGSLVPLDLNDLSVEAAISRFKNIHYLNLGAESRADWIANILLYIPLSFGMLATFGGIHHPLGRALLSIGVLIFCLTLAVAAEFAQLFFPPRTVSLNDLIAESLGSAIGILGWHLLGGYFSKLYRQLLRGGLLSAQAAIFFYLLIYIGLSLFPFDFITSIAELNTKLANGHDAVFLPFDACRSETVRCGVKLLAEMLVLLPLGLLFCYLPYLQHRILVAVLVGFFLGLAIEIVQVFLLSGSGQGISVVTRMLGMGAGAGLFVWAKQSKPTDLLRLLRPAVWITILPYIVLVLSINGWFSATWSTPQQALEKLTTTRFLPLYYFYYTSEGVALVSLLSNIGMYFPVGLLCWASFFNLNYEHKHHRTHWFFVGLLAATFALVVETGKLFLANKHTDPSDVWIAFIAAAGCYAFMSRLWQWINRDKTPAKPPIVERVKQLQIIAPENPVDSMLPAYEVDKRWRALSLLLWCLISIALFNYPLASAGLGLFLIGYTALLMYFPYAWLVVVPALVPIMDFAPWTGRFFFDEFDLLILTTLAFYYWQKPKRRFRSLLSIPTLLLLTLFIVIYGLSLLKGLLPLPDMDVNAFSNYYSHYNGLRVGKGFIWSLLLLPLVQLTVRRYRVAPLYLGYGVLLGLAGVIVVSCRERFLFPGLFDFSSNYRIIALFSSMHTGGGHIDAYLALTLPFIALLFLSSSRPWLTGALGIGLFITGLYVLLITFSRGSYLAAGVNFIVLIIGLLWCFKSNLASQWHKFLWFPLLLIIVSVIVIPVLKGTFIQERFSTTDRDIDIRKAHWRDAITMMDDDIPTCLLGMGIGSYPRTYLLRNSEGVTPAMYQINSENGNQYLKLESGDSLYMGQYIAVKPHTSYLLSVDLRSSKDSVTLAIPICEKSLLYSFRCSGTTITEKAPAGQWQHIERLIDSKEVSAPLSQMVGDLTRRPVQLSLYNDKANIIIEIDNVSLTDATGKNLIANGDFTQGMDFWFFSTDNHLPWHIKNLPVQVVFDQGWLGVIAFFLLFANAIYTLCHQLKRQNGFAAVLLSSFSGFMVVGFVDSPFDTPRLTLLFFLLLFFALMRPPHAWAKI